MRSKYGQRHERPHVAGKHGHDLDMTVGRSPVRRTVQRTHSQTLLPVDELSSESVESSKSSVGNTLSPLPPPPSTTPTLRHLLANVALSPLPRHRHRQRSAAYTSICRPQQAHNERHGNATSPTEQALATTPHYRHTTARPHRPRNVATPLPPTTNCHVTMMVQHVNGPLRTCAV
jgi:hypothetical protein